MNNYFIAIIIVLVSLYFIYNIHTAIKIFKDDKKNKLSKKTVTNKFIKNIFLDFFNTLDFRLWF